MLDNLCSLISSFWMVPFCDFVYIYVCVCVLGLGYNAHGCWSSADEFDQLIVGVNVSMLIDAG